MQHSIITELFLPIALGIIMFGLGLSLTLDDFRRIAKYPKAVVVALSCQMILLPALCFLLVRLFGLEPALAIGMMLLAASPGGATANLYSHLSGGDVALNITLTAINSVLSLFTLPLIVNFSIEYFMNSDQAIPIQFAKIIEVFGIVLIPVVIGMFVKNRFTNFAARMEKLVKIASLLILVIIIISVMIKERQVIADYFMILGLPILLFNLISLASGYFIPRWMNIGKPQAIAIGMEVGIHNGTLAIYIALSVLVNSLMAVPPALYSILMFFTAGVFGYLVKKNREKKPG